MKKRQQTWKRILSLALTAFMLLGLPGGMELTAAAAETMQDAAEQVQEQLAAARAVSYTPEGGTYTLNFDNGTITGFTALEDFDGNLVIPEAIEGESVTAIGDYAFYRNSYTDKDKLTSVQVPATVTTIGASAFYSCYYLTTVSGAENVRVIGDSAFSNCSRLNSAPDFENLVSLGPQAFLGTALTSVSIPAGLTQIPNSAFQSCAALTEIRFHEGVTEIGSSAFSNCTALREVTLPSTLTSMGNQVFSGCSALEEVSIPGSVTDIPQQAFYDCAALTSVELGEGVTSIGQRAFQDCTALTSINFPASLTTLHGEAFGNCGFTSITIPATITTYSGVNGYGYTFNGCKNLETVSIASPNLSTCMFTSCDNLKSVVLEETVETVPYGAFQYCSQLSDITFYNPETEIYDGTLVQRSALRFHGL